MSELRAAFSFRLILAAALLLAGFSVVPASAQASLRVTHVINGTLGDRSFFDSAQAGLERAAKELGIALKTIELGEDQARWETGIDDAMSDVDNYDVIVLGGSLIADFVMARADSYPDKRFIFHDEPLDFGGKCKCANVYNVIYAQNEGSYLAGTYAVAMQQFGGLPNLAGKNTLGVIGGLDIPVINDFIVGFEAGARALSPDVVILRQYVGGDKPFFDRAKGFEIATAMYEQGADFVFSVAGGTGDGAIAAAAAKGRFSIGVDSDQWLLYKDTDPKGADTILTSMIKNVGNAVYRALALLQQDKLTFGQIETVGITEGAIGLAKNEYYERITPDVVRQIIETTERGIVLCNIAVPTALTARPCTPPPATPDATPGS